MLTDNLYRSLSTIPSLQAQVRRIVKKLPHRFRTVERFGQRLIIDPSELAGYYLYYEREYDDFIFKFLDPILPKYSIALDVGANIGIYTCYLAARIKHVDAFEPDPFLCSWLRKNLALNHLFNISVHETCVGLEDGAVSFFPSDGQNRGIGSIIGMGTSRIERSCICLDSFLRTIRLDPCLLKIDIEGAELLALQGAKNVLSQPGAPIDILMEVHPEEIRKLGGTVKQLHELLLELGYSVAAITLQGLLELDADSEETQRFWWASCDSIIAHAQGQQHAA